MREFDLGAFAEHLLLMQSAEMLALHHGLDRAAAHIEQVAKDEFGNYQPEVGQFPEWAELADSTKMDRLNKGFDPDEPLLRTGELRDSISHETHALEAVVGSTSDIMVYQEFGTATIPPRPVLGPAAIRSKEVIEKLVGYAAISGLVGGRRIPSEFGYDFVTQKTTSKP